MARLQHVLDRIESLTSFSPGTDGYQVEVTDTFNEVYVDLFESRPWHFAVKEVEIHTLDDFSTTGDIQLDPELYISNLSDITLTTEYEGCVCTISGADDDRDNGDFIVDKVETGASSAIYVSRIDGDKRGGWHDTTVGVTVDITHRYITLPGDCTQTVGLEYLDGDVARDIANISRDNMGRRNNDITGSPNEWAEFDALNACESVIPGDLSVTLTSVTSSAAWPEGDYTFYMGYQLHGQVGSLSEGVAATISTDESPLFATIDSTLNRNHGLRKKIFVRIDDVSNYEESIVRDLGSYDSGIDDLTSDGFNYFIIDDDNTSQQWLSTLPSSLSFLKSLNRAPENDGLNKRIQTYPHSTDGLRLRLRYIRRPQKVKEVTDLIEAPKDVTQYLIYRTLEVIQLKQEEYSASEHWRLKADKLFETLLQRYITQSDAWLVKGNLSSRRWVSDRNTVTYLG